MEDEAENTEIEVELEPRSQALAELGISTQELEAALGEVVQSYNNKIERLDDSAVIVPNIEDEQIEISGRSFRLGDVAKIV